MRWRRTYDNSIDDAGFEWVGSDGTTLEPTDDEMIEYANRDNPSFRR